MQLILVINRRTIIEYYANKFSTLIPIKPLGLIVHGLCFLGVNVYAIKRIFKKNKLIPFGPTRALQLLTDKVKMEKEERSTLPVAIEDCG